MKSIAGYLASRCEIPSSNPPIYLKGDFSPWEWKQTKSAGPHSQITHPAQKCREHKMPKHIYLMQELVKAIREKTCLSSPVKVHRFLD